MDFTRVSTSLRASWHAVSTYAKAHKVVATVVVLVVLYGVYYGYGKLTAPSTAPRYVTTTVATGTVVATLTETGQVSSSHQLNLSPKASGQIVSINVRPGQQVGQGQLLVALDATDAVQALTDAKLSLQTAELTYQQDTATSTLSLNLLQAQNNVTNAETSLQKAHDSAYASLASIYTDLSTIMSGLDSALHNEDVSGRKTQQNIDAFADLVSNHDDSITIFKTSAQTSYTEAITAYNSALLAYKATDRSASDAELIALAQTTYTAAQAVAEAVKDSHDFFDRVNSDFTLYNLGSSATLTSILSSVTGYTITATTDLSNALSQKTDIVSAKQTLAEAQNTLETTEQGSNTITVQSAALDLRKAQEAVSNAEQTLSDYYVRAPFAGTVASVPVQLYDQASSGTTVATITTSQKTVDISVNEVDAAKIKTGQKATITFDALPDITVAGTVASVNTIGTAAQGVVSYDAVVAFDTPNDQVLPGMSATADIVIGTETGLVVPATAVKSLAGQSYVQTFATAPSGSESASGAESATPPTNVPVTTGLTDDTQTIITTGLSGGETVVTKTIAGTAATTAGAAVPSGASLLRGASGGNVRVQTAGPGLRGG